VFLSSFGYIEFSSTSAVDKAIKYDGFELDGRFIRVDYAKTRISKSKRLKTHADYDEVEQQQDNHLRHSGKWLACLELLQSFAQHPATSSNERYLRINIGTTYQGTSSNIQQHPATSSNTKQQADVKKRRTKK
jgi:RNA recognition motif-containing protein